MEATADRGHTEREPGPTVDASATTSATFDLAPKSLLNRAWVVLLILTVFLGSVGLFGIVIATMALILRPESRLEPAWYGLLVVSLLFLLLPLLWPFAHSRPLPEPQ